MSPFLSRLRFAEAAGFYEATPTARYDEEAAHALRSFFPLVEALDDLRTEAEQVSGIDPQVLRAATDALNAATLSHWR